MTDESLNKQSLLLAGGRCKLWFQPTTLPFMQRRFRSAVAHETAPRALDLQSFNSKYLTHSISPRC